MAQYYLPKSAPVSRQKKQNTSSGADKVLGESVRWAILLFFAIFLAVPLYWLVIGPTKQSVEFVNLPPLAFGSFANILGAWQSLAQFDHGIMGLWTLNSLLYAAGAVVIGVAFAVPAGYALATQRFAGRRVILVLSLIAMITPGATLVVPIFLEASYVGMIDNPWSVILTEAFFPSGVYLIYIFYVSSLPPDLLAAGRIDGCNEWQLFRYLALPVARPILGLVTFFAFVASWNNYFLPSVMLFDDSKFPLQMGLGELASASVQFNPAKGFTLHFGAPELLLSSLITVVPVVIVFVIFQRIIIATGGGLSGAEKS